MALVQICYFFYIYFRNGNTSLYYKNVYQAADGTTLVKESMCYV